MKKSRILNDQVSYLFLVVISIYLLQAIATFFSDKSPPIVDFVVVISILIAAFILHLVLGFKKTVPICLFLGFFLHIVGLYKIIPYNLYYVGELYGAPQLGYHYDWLVHFFGAGFLAVALSSAFYPYLRKSIRSRYAIFMILLFAIVGFGAMNEVSEFIGFTIFGHGEGFLEFGAGDASPNEGPWQNSSMDMINNTLGGIIFIGSFILIKKYRQKRRHD